MKLIPALRLANVVDFLLSQISRNFAKNGVKSFAFRENLKTQNYSHSTQKPNISDPKPPKNGRILV